MAYDPFSTTDGLFATLMMSQDQSAIANSALSTGLNFYKDKKYDKAIAQFRRAIAADPTSTQSHRFLANTLLAQDKKDEAIKAYQNALRLDPSQDDIHTSLANIHMAKKDYKSAEKEFKEAIKLNPSSELAPYMLGQMYQQNGRYAEAEAMFKKVIRMVPRDPNPHYALGATYNKEGKYEEAVKELTQAIKLRPKMVPAHFELGVAYAALGDTAKAQRQLETLTSLDKVQGVLLKETLKQPKFLTAGTESTDFFSTLGPNTQLYALDVSLIEPGKSQEFSMSFYFDTKMDPQSVQDPQNWTLTKASGGVAGYYNNTLAIAPTEAYIPQNPTRVAYNPTEQKATVTFMLSQNATGDATIDPSHMVFKFSGKDVYGKAMDPTANEYDGYAQVAF